MTEKMDSIIFDNKYVEIIYAVFNAHLYGEEVEVTVKKDFKFLGIIPYTKNVSEMKNLTVLNVDEQLRSFRERELSNTINIVNFISLWQFCQFVRFAEKAFYYPNTPEMHLYVDSEMNDLSKRAFKIKTDDRMEIFCNLEKVTDPINKKKINVIRLKIQRNYGKQMLNEFTIVDDFVKSKDASDTVLIENIFYLISEEIKGTFGHILNRAVRIGQERNKNERKYKVLKVL